MSLLRAYLFGRCHVICGEQPIPDLSTKSQELFYYLLFYQDRSHFRETLIDLLWDGCTLPKSKGYLRKALWQLQSVLEAHSESSCDRILLVDAEWIQINPAVDVWTDVDVLKQAFRQVQGTPGRDLNAEHAQCLSSAVQLYRGDLLEGCYADWCLREREWCRFMFMACLDKLLDYYAAQHNYEASIAYGERILRYDRARERTHRKMMHLYYLMGDRTGALRQYEHCRTALHEELDVEPTPRTEALYQRILTEQLDAISPIIRMPKSLSVISSEAFTILKSMQELRNLLGFVQSELTQFVQDAEIGSNDST